MTQFEHTFIAYILTMGTGLLFRRFLIFEEEYSYWDEWFNKRF